MVDLLLETNGTADQPTAEPNEDLVDSVHSSLTEEAGVSSSSEGKLCYRFPKLVKKKMT
jgi:hypothetical protein